MRGAPFLIALAIAAGSCKSDVALPATTVDARDVPSDIVADIALDVSFDAGEAPVSEVGPEASMVTCETILKAYSDLVNGADKSCLVDADCRIEGDSNMSCEARGLSVQCGVSVNTRAFPAGEAANLRAAAYRLGCRSGSFDCGRSDAVCAGSRCIEQFVSGCLSGPEPGRDGG